MNQPGTSANPRILMAPLDWGLGHATRCIPVIRAFLDLGCSVILAGEGKVRSLLGAEFPSLPFVPLKGYGIRYSRIGRLLPLVLGTQIPKIISGIKYENERVRELVKELQVHALFSDNRYGFYHPGLPSVFMGHQLQIHTGWGSMADQWLRKINYKHIEHFSECWVPDVEQWPGWAGTLSHPAVKPGLPVKYLGPLSRFHNRGNTGGDHLLFLLSGPEPQRSLLEAIFLQELKDYPGKAVLVRGLPGGDASITSSGNVKVFAHLDAARLEQMVAGASMVIARCGYSTVMDLAVMQKKSILIPTPGQTEQEYLARHLMRTQRAFCVDQTKFKLRPALELAESFPYLLDKPGIEGKMEEAVKDFVERLREKGEGRKQKGERRKQ